MKQHKEIQEHDVMHPSGAWAECLGGLGGHMIMITIPITVQDKATVAHEICNQGLEYLGLVEEADTTSDTQRP